MRLGKLFAVVLAALALFLSAQSSRAGLVDGMGIVALGDSMSMQYSVWVPRASAFGYQINSNGTQFNWVDHLIMSDYNFGPREQYIIWYRNAYDLALVGTQTPILSSQVQNAQAYISSKAAELVVLNMGANDFGNDGRYRSIYNKTADPNYNPLVDPEVNALLDRISGNLAGAVDSTLALNADARMILTTIPNLGITPSYLAQYTDAARRDRVGEVFDAVNQRIIELAQQHHFPVVDLDGLAKVMSTSPTIDGVQILNAGGVTGNYGFLSDGFHPGTVLQGMLANTVLMANQIGYNDPVQFISDQTILTRAGLTPLSTTPSYFDVSPYVIFTPVPEPSTFVLAAVGTAALGLRLRRRRQCSK